MYYDLRWRILRKPWNQPQGSEQDDLEESSFHRMIVNEKGKTLGVGRIQINFSEEAQIRYMAVEDGYQNKGIGKLVLQSLEEIAAKKNVNFIILQARGNALTFYKSSGYQIVEKSYLLFGEIQHWLMRK
ncbi:uncharacterized protein METZ01_LOCUS502435, partial [marine metagenome]